MPAPGDGPTDEQTKGNRVEYRGIAYPDVGDVATKSQSRPRAYCRSYWEGGMYHRRFLRCYVMIVVNRNYKGTDTNEMTVTGLILTEAAITLLKDDTMAKKSGGGVLTPATLGRPLIDRLDAAGFTFETKMLD